MGKLKIILLLAVCSLTFAGKNLTIYFMPESHNDPGWGFTEEEYYQKSTKHTFTTVTNYMAKNS